MMFPKYDDRARNIDRGIGSTNQSDDEGKCKIMNDRPSEEEEDQYHHHDSSRSENGSSKGFIDTDIENRLKAFLPHLFNILSHPVKNDDGIIDREPDNRQDN